MYCNYITTILVLQLYYKYSKVQPLVYSILVEHFYKSTLLVNYYFDKWTTVLSFISPEFSCFVFICSTVRPSVLLLTSGVDPALTSIRTSLCWYWEKLSQNCEKKWMMCVIERQRGSQKWVSRVVWFLFFGFLWFLNFSTAQRSANVVFIGALKWNLI